MRLRTWQIARSVLSNWLATIAGMAVAFFLSPFLVHRLGNVAYGVWILCISLINYLGLLDLGLRNSVTMFISKGHTTGDHGGTSEIFSAALWARVQLSGVVLALSGVFAVAFPHAFKVSSQLAVEARAAILLMGLSFAIYMSVGIFAGVLSALQRYDLYTVVVLIQLSLRVITVVAVVKAGHGIVAIAGCELFAATVGNLLFVLVARGIYPELKVHFKKPRSETLKTIWAYSAYVSILMVAIQLVYQTDNLVVGAFVSASAATFYSIANSLCRYTQQLVTAMTTVFTPAATSYQAAGDSGSLHALYRNGTRATMAFSLPILISFIVRGGNFIGVWMGSQYARVSGTVLVILAVALMFSLQNTPASSIAFGIEKHQRVAKWAVGEALANLLLSILLARTIGIYGVAIGTLLPSLVVNLFFWPRYISHLVAIRYHDVLLKIWGPQLCAAVPFAAGSLLVDVYAPAQSMRMFILQTLLLLPLFIVPLAILFRAGIRRNVLPKLRSYFAIGAN